MDRYVPPIQVELMDTPRAQKSTGGFPKLENEANTLLTSWAEMVKIFVPFTRAGEEVLASGDEFPAAKTNLIPFAAPLDTARSKALEMPPSKLIFATSPT